MNRQRKFDFRVDTELLSLESSEQNTQHPTYGEFSNVHSEVMLGQEFVKIAQRELYR
jgi:hypothetical protein